MFITKIAVKYLSDSTSMRAHAVRSRRSEVRVEKAVCVHHTSPREQVVLCINK